MKLKQYDNFERRCGHCMFWNRSTSDFYTGECMATKPQSDGKSPFLMFIRPIPEKLETRAYFGCEVFQPGRKNLEADMAERKKREANDVSPT
jgi:hypothetical protein